ncbi:hypothetical protein RND81_02G095200 [Saponaria officinalis]
MCELSVADGFVEINENLGDMIKYIANEPSVGLYYIQQHAQNAVPNVVRLKNNIRDKSNEVTFHTEDLEDSIAMTRTMKECGFPIINDMIRDINTSLTIISSKQPVRGVISRRSSGYQIGGPSTDGYFSTVLKTAKEKAGNLKWPQIDPSKEAGEITEVCPPGSNDSDELPLSSQVENEITEESNISVDGKTQQSPSEESNFDEFRAGKEALLEEWLTNSGSVL